MTLIFWFLCGLVFALCVMKIVRLFVKWMDLS